MLSLLDRKDKILQVEFTEFAGNRKSKRGVPVKYLQTKSGSIAFTTIYDLIMGQYGVDRGLGGEYPSSYDDAASAYTPAWQETYTGISSATVIQFAREWCSTAEMTDPRCRTLCTRYYRYNYYCIRMLQAHTALRRLFCRFHILQL